MPIANYTEELQEANAKKRGKEKEVKKEICQITEFKSVSEESNSSQLNLSSKSLSNNHYVYLADFNYYGLIKSKKSDSLIVFKIRPHNKEEEELVGCHLV